MVSADAQISHRRSLTGSERSDEGKRLIARAALDAEEDERTVMY